MGYGATATDILNDFPRYRNYNFLITELPVSDQFSLLSFLYKVEIPVKVSAGFWSCSHSDQNNKTTNVQPYTLG